MCVPCCQAAQGEASRKRKVEREQSFVPPPEVERGKAKKKAAAQGTCVASFLSNPTCIVSVHIHDIVYICMHVYMCMQYKNVCTYSYNICKLLCALIISPTCLLCVYVVACV